MGADISPENNGNLRELATMPIGRLLWKYSLPAVVGMLVMQLYNIVDRIFIGQVIGPEAIAGLAITFPVMNIATALGVLVGAGASARVSIHLGQRDYEGAHARHRNCIHRRIRPGDGHDSPVVRSQ